MFQDNIDWEATKAIYTNSIVDDGIIELELSFNGMVGIRRILPPSKKPTSEEKPSSSSRPTPLIYDLTDNNNNNNDTNNNHNNGINTTNDDEKEEDENKIDSTFEYCFLSSNFQAPPTVRLTFKYTKTDNEEGDDGMFGMGYEDEVDEIIMTELQSVRVEIINFPPELELLQVSPATTATSNNNNKETKKSSSNHYPNHKKQWERWLQSQCDEILNEEKLSFSICEFIEHQAYTYFYILHKDETLGYSALLFHDKEHNEYEHYNPSSILIWKESTMYVTKHDTDYQQFKKQKYDDIRKNKKMKNKQSIQSIQSNGSSVDTNNHNNIPTDELHDYAMEAIQQEWKKQIKFNCPICFDTITCHEGVELPCRHFLCMTCAEYYIKSKLSELHMYRHSPFICPIVECKQGMKIKSGSYPITKNEKKSIDDWKFNMKYPTTHILTQCPRKSCQSTDMRRSSSSFTETMVFCNDCERSYCELCLQQYKNKDCSRKDHESHICDESIILKLCRRYKGAKHEIQQKAEEKWHWLKDYASAREEDCSAKLWVSEHASRCPNCRTAIERTEGCFHIHCTLCGTHFCYECGEEIFYPFYGTHHCWEEAQIFNDFD